ncbi:MAG: DNA polymerase III subunit delta [Chloroflexota bacterium]|nr:DNA polymerase III subunit delta [Chloroflexota bacterium]
MTTAPLAYFWGEDAWSIDRAARDYRAALEAEAGSAFDVWRASSDDDDGGGDSGGASDGMAKKKARVLDEIGQHIATATLFGGGTLVIVRQPGWLLRESASRERLLKMTTEVAPGNALCFAELLAQGGKPTVPSTEMRNTIEALGGQVREFQALNAARMEGWIGERARELDVTLGPGAARLLAERVGAYVREGDVDRRRMSELANAELEKLALYRPGGTVTRDDIDALVGEAVPGSTWAFLDALGNRSTAMATSLAARLINEATPMPVLITQIHRRLRDLIIIRDHLAAGTKPADIVRELKMQPFRAQKLSEQARSWSQSELDDALQDLYEIDLLTKGISSDGSPHSMSEDKSSLALLAWIGGHANLRRKVGVGEARAESRSR